MSRDNFVRWKKEVERSADVLTRAMDEYTNAVAIGIAKCLARVFDGEVEE